MAKGKKNNTNNNANVENEQLINDDSDKSDNKERSVLDEVEGSMMKIIDKRIKESQAFIINFLEMNSRVMHGRIDKIMEDVNSLKHTAEFREDIFEKKLKDVRENIDKIKSEMLNQQQYLQRSSANGNDNSVINEIKSKLVDLENRSRRNNLRFEGIAEEDEEDWNKCEEKIKNIVKEKLDIDADNISIERAHRAGKKKDNKHRVIIARFLDFKDKEKILKRANRLKNSGIYINEDFAEETMKKRADLLPLLKQYRAEGKYAVIKYDEIIVREWRK